MQKALRSKTDGRVLMYTPALAETGMYDLIDRHPKVDAEDVDFKETPVVKTPVAPKAAAKKKG